MPKELLEGTLEGNRRCRRHGQLWLHIIQECTRLSVDKAIQSTIRNEANGELVQPKDISVKGWTVVMEIDKHIQ